LEIRPLWNLAVIRVVFVGINALKHIEMKEVKFPVYTTVAPAPDTICEVVGAAAFDYPFFNDGVVHSRAQLTERKTYKLVDLDTSDAAGLLEIKGFIFHTAHCGSTLLSKMLSKLPKVRVVSETEAINGLLLSALLYDLPEATVLNDLKRIIDAYRQPIHDEQYLIFKMTSWNVFLVHLFQKLNPDTNWIYIDRDTEDTVQSLLKSGRGFVDWYNHPVDSMRRCFLSDTDIYENQEGYIRLMLLKHRHFAQQGKNEKSCFVDYPDFIAEYESVILPHFNLDYSKADIALSLEMTKFESKQYKEVAFKKQPSIME
jgi:hypothetical protein